MAAATASEQLRKNSLSKEELEAERLEKLKKWRIAATARMILKEQKTQAQEKEYQDAVASVAAKNGARESTAS